MSSKGKFEFKVGIFVLIGLAIFVTFIFYIRGLKSFASGYDLKMTFRFVNGVKVGAPVRLAGVDVGEVKNIMIDEGKDNLTRVCVWTKIKRGINIPAGSDVRVNTLGLLGEKYLEIIPAQSPSYLEPGAEISGHDPLAMHEVTDLLQKVAEDLEGIIKEVKSGRGTIGKLVYDPSLYDGMKSTLNSLDGAAKELDAIIKQARSKDGSLGKFLYDSRLYDNIEEMFADLKAHPWKLLFKPKEAK